MSVPTFGPVPVDIYEQGGLIRAGDVMACRRLKYLSEELTLSALNGTHRYARGTWGHTVLRTIYTPASDVSFGPMLERLKRWVHYGLRSDQRLLSRPRPQAYEGGASEDHLDPDAELRRRFYVDVVEDREGLGSLPDGDFIALREYFHRWVRVVAREDPESGDWNSRFCDCLVIDAVALASLEAMGEPPLEEELGATRTPGDGWLWLMDTRRMGRGDPTTGSDDEYKGWMRLRVTDIGYAWFQRLFSHDGRFDLRVRQKIASAPDFWFNPSGK